MSKQAETEIMKLGETEMSHGNHFTEYESIVRGKSGELQMVVVLVSAHPLNKAATTAALQATEAGESSIEAVRRLQSEKEPAFELPGPSGEQLQALGAVALANGHSK